MADFIVLPAARSRPGASRCKTVLADFGILRREERLSGLASDVTAKSDGFLRHNLKPLSRIRVPPHHRTRKS
jgi:hypothetical protein